MNIISVSKSVIFTLLSFCVTSAQGDQLNIPNKFKKGDVLIADDMNTNFNAIEDEVNSLKKSLGARSQFVGFSTKGVNGGAGIFEMQRVCAEKDAKSHVCNTSEIMQSTYDPAVIDALPAELEAWVLIDVSNTIISKDQMLTQFGLIDSSPPKLSCDGWTSSAGVGDGAFGLTVTNRGIFKTVTSCDKTLHVACCK